MRRFVSWCTLLCFILTSTIPVQAQAVLSPPPVSTPKISQINANKTLTTLKGLTYFPDEPFKLDFIVTDPIRHPEGAYATEGSRLGDPRFRGDDTISSQDFEAESAKLIQYFLASLTTPDDEMWVNLSPHEPDRIIADKLGQTQMGRDMLTQDLELKKLTASLLHPDTEIGQQFWDRVYAKAFEKYGTTEIPVNTFHKVWIVPQNATVYRHENNVFVVDRYLKVMLEHDYVAAQSHKVIKSYGHNKKRKNQWSEKNSEIRHLEESDVSYDSMTYDFMTVNHDEDDLSSEVMRDVIIPEIESLVNKDESFANLRQIYDAMILATWYKRNLKKSVLNQVYADENKSQGHKVIRSQERKESPEEIWKAYKKTFEEGVYDFIRDERRQTKENTQGDDRMTYDPMTYDHEGSVAPRRYFSGGLVHVGAITEIDKAQLSQPQRTAFKDQAMNVSVDLLPEASKATDHAMTTPDFESMVRIYGSEGNFSIFQHPTRADWYYKVVPKYEGHLIELIQEKKALKNMSIEGIPNIIDEGKTQNDEVWVLFEGKEALIEYEGIDLSLVDRIGGYIRFAEILEEAHQQGYVYNDLKFEHSLANTEGEYLIIDWGLSVPIGGTYISRQYYRAPETKKYPYSDVYSFGLILKESSLYYDMYYDETGSFREDQDGVLFDLINRMISENPRDRPQSMREVIIELQQVLVYFGAFDAHKSTKTDGALTVKETFIRDLREGLAGEFVFQAGGKSMPVRFEVVDNGRSAFGNLTVRVYPTEQAFQFWPDLKVINEVETIDEYAPPKGTLGVINIDVMKHKGRDSLNIEENQGSRGFYAFLKTIPQAKHADWRRWVQGVHEKILYHAFQSGMSNVYATKSRTIYGRLPPLPNKPSMKTINKWYDDLYKPEGKWKDYNHDNWFLAWRFIGDLNDLDPENFILQPQDHAMSAKEEFIQGLQEQLKGTFAFKVNDKPMPVRFEFKQHSSGSIRGDLTIEVYPTEETFKLWPEMKKVDEIEPSDEFYPPRGSIGTLSLDFSEFGSGIHIDENQASGGFYEFLKTEHQRDHPAFRQWVEGLREWVVYQALQKGISDVSANTSSAILDRGALGLSRKMLDRWYDDFHQDQTKWKQVRLQNRWDAWKFIGNKDDLQPEKFILQPFDDGFDWITISERSGLPANMRVRAFLLSQEFYIDEQGMASDYFSSFELEEWERLGFWLWKLVPELSKVLTKKGHRPDNNFIFRDDVLEVSRFEKIVQRLIEKNQEAQSFNLYQIGVGSITNDVDVIEQETYFILETLQKVLSQQLGDAIQQWKINFVALDVVQENAHKWLSQNLPQVSFNLNLMLAQADTFDSEAMKKLGQSYPADLIVDRHSLHTAYMASSGGLNILKRWPFFRKFSTSHVDQYYHFRQIMQYLAKRGGFYFGGYDSNFIHRDSKKRRILRIPGLRIISAEDFGETDLSQKHYQQFNLATAIFEIEDPLAVKNKGPYYFFQNIETNGNPDSAMIGRSSTANQPSNHGAPEVLTPTGFLARGLSLDQDVFNYVAEHGLVSFNQREHVDARSHRAVPMYPDSVELALSEDYQFGSEAFDHPMVFIVDPKYVRERPKEFHLADPYFGLDSRSKFQYGLEKLGLQDNSFDYRHRLGVDLGSSSSGQVNADNTIPPEAILGVYVDAYYLPRVKEWNHALLQKGLTPFNMFTFKDNRRLMHLVSDSAMLATSQQLPLFLPDQWTFDYQGKQYGVRRVVDEAPNTFALIDPYKQSLGQVRLQYMQSKGANVLRFNNDGELSVEHEQGYMAFLLDVEERVFGQLRMGSSWRDDFKELENLVSPWHTVIEYNEGVVERRRSDEVEWVTTRGKNSYVDFIRKDSGFNAYLPGKKNVGIFFLNLWEDNNKRGVQVDANIRKAYWGQGVATALNQWLRHHALFKDIPFLKSDTDNPNRITTALRGINKGSVIFNVFNDSQGPVSYQNRSNVPQRAGGWYIPFMNVLLIPDESSIIQEAYLHTGLNSQKTPLTVQPLPDEDGHQRYHVYSKKNSGVPYHLNVDLRVEVADDLKITVVRLSEPNKKLLVKFENHVEMIGEFEPLSDGAMTSSFKAVVLSAIMSLLGLSAQSASSPEEIKRGLRLMESLLDQSAIPYPQYFRQTLTQFHQAMKEERDEQHYQETIESTLKEMHQDFRERRITGNHFRLLEQILRSVSIDYGYTFRRYISGPSPPRLIMFYRVQADPQDPRVYYMESFGDIKGAYNGFVLRTGHPLLLDRHNILQELEVKGNPYIDYLKKQGHVSEEMIGRVKAHEESHYEDPLVSYLRSLFGSDLSNVHFRSDDEVEELLIGFVGMMPLYIDYVPMSELFARLTESFHNGDAFFTLSRYHGKKPENLRRFELAYLAIVSGLPRIEKLIQEAHDSDVSMYGYREQLFTYTDEEKEFMENFMRALEQQVVIYVNGDEEQVGLAKNRQEILKRILNAHGLLKVVFEKWVKARVQQVGTDPEKDNAMASQHADPEPPDPDYPVATSDDSLLKTGQTGEQFLYLGEIDLDAKKVAPGESTKRHVYIHEEMTASSDSKPAHFAVHIYYTQQQLTPDQFQQNKFAEKSFYEHVGFLYLIKEDLLWEIESYRPIGFISSDMNHKYRGSTARSKVMGYVLGAFPKEKNSLMMKTSWFDAVRVSLVSPENPQGWAQFVDGISIDTPEFKEKFFDVGRVGYVTVVTLDYQEKPLALTSLGNSRYRINPMPSSGLGVDEVDIDFDDGWLMSHGERIARVIDFQKVVQLTQRSDSAMTVKAPIITDGFDAIVIERRQNTPNNLTVRYIPLSSDFNVSKLDPADKFLDEHEIEGWKQLGFATEDFTPALAYSMSRNVRPMFNMTQSSPSNKRSQVYIKEMLRRLVAKQEKEKEKVLNIYEVGLGKPVTSYSLFYVLPSQHETAIILNILKDVLKNKDPASWKINFVAIDVVPENARKWLTLRLPKVEYELNLMLVQADTYDGEALSRLKSAYQPHLVVELNTSYIQKDILTKKPFRRNFPKRYRYVASGYYHIRQLATHLFEPGTVYITDNIVGTKLKKDLVEPWPVLRIPGLDIIPDTEFGGEEPTNYGQHFFNDGTGVFEVRNPNLVQEKGPYYFFHNIATNGNSDGAMTTSSEPVVSRLTHTLEPTVDAAMVAAKETAKPRSTHTLVGEFQAPRFSIQEVEPIDLFSAQGDRQWITDLTKSHPDFYRQDSMDYTLGAVFPRLVDFKKPVQMIDIYSTPYRWSWKHAVLTEYNLLESMASRVVQDWYGVEVGRQQEIMASIIETMLQDAFGVVVTRRPTMSLSSENYRQYLSTLLHINQIDVTQILEQHVADLGAKMGVLLAVGASSDNEVTGGCNVGMRAGKAILHDFDQGFVPTREHDDVDIEYYWDSISSDLNGVWSLTFVIQNLMSDLLYARENSGTPLKEDIFQDTLVKHIRHGIEQVYRQVFLNQNQQVLSNRYIDNLMQKMSGTDLEAVLPSAHDDSLRDGVGRYLVKLAQHYVRGDREELEHALRGDRAMTTQAPGGIDLDSRRLELNEVRSKKQEAGSEGWASVILSNRNLRHSERSEESRSGDPSVEDSFRMTRGVQDDNEPFTIHHSPFTNIDAAMIADLRANMTGIVPFITSIKPIENMSVLVGF